MRQTLLRLDVISWLHSLFTDNNDQSIIRKMAGTAFLIRVTGAALIYLSQVAFARWMGAFEFGVFIYVWTWVLLFGDIMHMGLAAAAQRLIPEYTRQKAYNSLRGFLSGSKWVVFSAATLVAIIAAFGIGFIEPWLGSYEVLPLYLACVTLPFYSLSALLDGIARCYNWASPALLPQYVLRPIFLFTAIAIIYFSGNRIDAATAMLAAIIATWAATILQLVWVNTKLADVVSVGDKNIQVREWLATSFPILAVWVFYTLLSYVDIVILRQFRPPEDVAVYYTASKTSALVAFIYFSVAAAAAHQFSEYYLSGNKKAFSDLVRTAVRWTFWPSVAATSAVLAFGQPILWLFGPGFIEGYGLMFIFAVGLLARASVGPAERLLNMVGEIRRCGFVYATAFLVNLVLCITLIPDYGRVGAAISLSTAMVIESVLLYYVAKTRLGLKIWVFSHA
ncbi:MAG: oligosaccharide flippase family protein [Hyphomicrobiales bacterium]|nr:oligosaccharide flippase family protein [Hyphomicrobiales bacterium]